MVNTIRELLVGRVQCVKIKNEFSDKMEITSGVSYESPLSRILFITFVNDL